MERRTTNRDHKRTGVNRVGKPAPARNTRTSDRRGALATNAVLYLHAHANNAATQGGFSASSSGLNLLDWNPAHFRLFVGNLGADANDALLAKAFDKYPSVSKVNVPMDRTTGKNRGYGFVAFSDAEEYLQAFQKMNGAYIGQHPVQLKRADPIKKPSKMKGGRGKR